MNPEKFSRLFPFGSHLCREPMPAMSEMKKDMEILKGAGFNLIKLQEHWSYDEPEEGVFDFSKYEDLIDYAARLDMGVYLGFTFEQAPAWLYQKYPDCHMVRRDGLLVSYEPQMTLPADGKPGPCFDHPGVRAAQESFLRKLVSVLGSRENIVVWNTWQEITTNAWSEGAAGGQQVCYCPHTVGFFREWLGRRYGDLDGLNKAWRTKFSDWKYVSPEKVTTKCLLPQTLDWNYFMENVAIARTLEDRCRIIKDADTLKRPVFAHRGAPQIASGADWVYAKTQDFLGSSCYPASPAWSGVSHWDDSYPRDGKVWEMYPALLAEVADCMVLRFDYIRSCNGFSKPVWAAEFQGGPTSNGFNIGRTPSKDDIRRWILSGLGSGLTGICFWVTRAEIAGAEANGYSLLDSAGDSTERFEEASRLRNALEDHADIFGRCSTPRASAAILVNDRNFQLCQLLPLAAEHLKYSLRGWHRLLWESGINVDFLEINHCETEDLAHYKALIMPVPLSLSESAAKKLGNYVRGGGSLISEACCGKFDDNGFCPRGELSPEMSAVFGVTHKGISMVREPENGKRWTPHEQSWGMCLPEVMLTGTGALTGHNMRANVYVETFECGAAKPALMAGDSVAGAVNGFGKGKAWLLGTFAGHNGGAHRDKETWAALLAILKDCGVEPVTAGKLLLSKRVTPDKEAWILFNPHPADVTEKIQVGNCGAVSDLLGESFEREKDIVELTVKSLDSRVLMLSK